MSQMSQAGITFSADNRQVITAIEQMERRLAGLQQVNQAQLGGLSRLSGQTRGLAGQLDNASNTAGRFVSRLAGIGSGVLLTKVAFGAGMDSLREYAKENEAAKQDLEDFDRSVNKLQASIGQHLSPVLRMLAGDMKALVEAGTGSGQAGGVSGFLNDTVNVVANLMSGKTVLGSGLNSSGGPESASALDAANADNARSLANGVMTAQISRMNKSVEQRLAEVRSESDFEKQRVKLRQQMEAELAQVPQAEGGNELRAKIREYYKLAEYEINAQEEKQARERAQRDVEYQQEEAERFAKRAADKAALLAGLRNDDYARRAEVLETSGDREGAARVRAALEYARRSEVIRNSPLLSDQEKVLAEAQLKASIQQGLVAQIGAMQAQADGANTAVFRSLSGGAIGLSSQIAGAALAAGNDPTKQVAQNTGDMVRLLEDINGEIKKNGGAVWR